MHFVHIVVAELIHDCGCLVVVYCVWVEEWAPAMGLFCDIEVRSWESLRNLRHTKNWPSA